MNVFQDITNLPKFKNAVVTIGSFDGVHLGHIQLINKIKSIAKDIDGEDVVVTFHPHPRSVIFPNDKSLVLLTDLDEKLNQFRKANVSNVVIVPFTPSFAQQSPREYIEKFILQSFDPAYLVIGYDHRFGLNRQGDFNLLEEYEKDGKFALVKIDKKEIHEIAVSSTNIRNNLLAGNITKANAALSYAYTLSGKVMHGQKLGSKLGFPTANIEVESKHKLVPKEGIYAVNIELESKLYGGMLYIGSKPTIDEASKTKVIEVNIFDFDQSIYGKKLTLHFIDFIREDVKFETLDKLSHQLSIDKIDAIKSLRSAVDSTTQITNAVVVLNYNGKPLLEKYLSSLKTSSENYNFDLIVIDNASIDDSVEYLKTNHEEVKIITLDHNFGYAGGYNEGLGQINNKYIALVNSDILGTPGWLDPIIALLEEDKTIACVQPKIRSLRNKQLFEYAGAAGGLMDWLGYPFCRGRIFDNIEPDNGQYDDDKEIVWASGAAFVIRNHIFKALGGFDESFFAHQEEIDLCLRIRRTGHKCFVSGKSHVFHLGGATLGYESPNKTYLNFRNNLLTLVKNFSTFRLLLILPIRLILDGIAGLKFLFDKHPSNAFAIIRAHFSFYWRLFPTLFSKSKESKIIEKLSIGKPRTTGLYLKSILVQYYLRSKNKYSDF